MSSSPKIVRREISRSIVDRAIRLACDDAGTAKTHRSFVNLLWIVRSRSDLLRPARTHTPIDADALIRLAKALLALVEDRRDWLRPIEHWVPQGRGAYQLFSSLAHHLFANYPVPPVLVSAWFGGTEWCARRRQAWFKHAGRGGSLRKAGFPITFNKRMAHEFAGAPAQFPIEFALRWAQVRGLGGSDDLARAVAASRLGREFSEESFWVAVVQLLRNSPRLDLARVDLLVEYLHDQKFEPRKAIIGEDTEIELDPPQPDLAIKGRTAASLLRDAAEWQARRQPPAITRRLIRWDPSGIGEYLKPADEGQTWTIRELLDSDHLAAEGKAMHHCVATYTEPCAKRRSTIWSLGLEAPEGRVRHVTIEVDPGSRAVIQAKSKYNEDPEDNCLGILKEWASREGLTVGCS